MSQTFSRLEVLLQTFRQRNGMCADERCITGLGTGVCGVPTAYRSVQHQQQLTDIEMPGALYGRE
jgi:hypothetical protein